MFLISFGIAVVAFVLASNIFGRIWAWIATALVTFAAMFIGIRFELDVLIYITVGLITLVLILLLLKQAIE